LSDPTHPGAWFESELVDTPAALHHAELSLGERRLWWLTPSAPAIVLGSAQREQTVDATAAARLGIEVARRRSGGGAVLVVPGEVVWLDVTVPRTDVLWDDDIGRSMWWLGDVWRRALSDLGVSGQVHHGPQISSPWSSVVCFAGLGAGEVTVDGRKVVGISQRRTRDGARLQSMCHLQWRPELLAELCADGGPGAGGLADLVAVAPGPAGAVRAALRMALADIDA
jgi:lipoate---protein ligase